MTTRDELRPGDFVTPSVRLVRPIGQGGMGTVWLAEHQQLDTRVVVKLMARGLEHRPDILARFAREAMIAAQVKSPHVVQVFDSGTTDSGVPYIVMELLEGHDLAKHLAEKGPMTPRALVPIVVQVAKALAKSHRVGIVHRDLKPDNIFLCDHEGGEPFVKLLDFGTAKVEQPWHRDMTSTDTGQVLGTPFYMSPEQIVGEKEVDARTDIWSLGVVAFEALTGKVPFEGATVAGIALSIHNDSPKMTDAMPELPYELDAWFARACAREPEARFQTVREAADAFVQAATGAPLVEPFESMKAPSVAVFPPPDRPFTPRPRVVTERPVALLSETLPKRGSERKSVTIAFGIVVAAAAAVSAVIVARAPSRPAPEPAAATAAAATAAKPAAPAAPTAPAATDTAVGERDEIPPPPAKVAAAPTPPKPNPPMTRGPRATSTKPPRPARTKATAKDKDAAENAAPIAGSDDDLVKLSNIDSGSRPAPPATSTPAPASTPAEPVPPKLPPAELLPPAE